MSYWLVREDLLRAIRHFNRIDALFVVAQDPGFGCVVDGCLGNECVVRPLCDCGPWGICYQWCGEE
jgi:hypothetical protein